MIRRAAAEDSAAIRRLFALHLEALGHWPDPELDADMEDPISHYAAFVVAEIDGALAGMGGIDRGQLRRIFVVPELRHRGLARRITEALMQTARDDGERAITAIVAKSNGAARRLFTSLGFVATGRSPDHPKMQHCEIFTC